jgi:hypothetical protein
MDDFSISTLHESRNEWCARLITILTPLMIEGFKTIFEESYKLCKDNNEMDKYLMTFQNLVSRIPKWNPTIIENERKRIADKSGCGYLEDLVTCVHIIQLKVLSAMRAGTKQKKIDINIPKFDDFVHKAYIHAARKVYKNVYLFESSIPPLQVQKNHRELEIIIQESILNAIRDSIPVETILRAYMEESVEEDIVEEIKEQVIPNPQEPVPVPSPVPSPVASSITGPVTTTSLSQTSNISESAPLSGRLSFNDVDLAIGIDNKEEQISAPKNLERLEQISDMRNEQRKLETDDDDEDGVRLNIFDESVQLSSLDVHNIEPPSLNLMPELLIDDIEVLA